jgi:hypothetical protein
MHDAAFDRNLIDRALNGRRIVCLAVSLGSAIHHRQSVEAG